MSHVIIVGGGASGLMAGIMAARNKHKVTILEHKDKAGKKILATGNGKCNFTNRIQEKDCYRGNNEAFIWKALELFSVNETISFFEELGIYVKDRNGYLYPKSEQAASVAEVLLSELKYLGVTIENNVHVEKIVSSNKGFSVISNGKEYKADKVIVATGGQASPSLGSDGSGYELVKKLGHSIVKPLPALVQLKSNQKYFKTISGVRTIASIKLQANEKTIAKEEGEILFAAYGVSGIPVMQVSRYAAKALEDKKRVDLEVDFFPELSIETLMKELERRLKRIPNSTIEEAMVGLLNNKLMFILIKESNIPVDMPCMKVSKGKIKELASMLKCFSIPIAGTNTFEQAQVCAGGVDTREVNYSTMESKLVKGLYMCGEILDVDGTCGGYNLQWAWTSGAIAGRSI